MVVRFWWRSAAPLSDVCFGVNMFQGVMFQVACREGGSP